MPTLQADEYRYSWGHGNAHWRQLNVKAMSRKELKFLANSESHLKMTK